MSPPHLPTCRGSARAFALLLAVALTAASAQPAANPPSPAGSPDVAKFIAGFDGRGVMRDNSPPLPASDALKSFTLRQGLAIDLIAAEPQVTQPLYLSFDSRGRLWVTQYIQYQYPAGLKVMSYDQHLRAVFDRTPEPPPRGTKGADKVTVLEDKDGDGTFETHRDVITGLNIATAAIKGGGGIWVLNPPYLLFYPDANDDDVPDSDPKVCLSGFGLEDTHAVANSLALGPDGWVYGAVGSTTTGNVSSRVTKNVRFQGQHIWRYHPRTEVFEIFAEGGGNTFSLEIDAEGRVFSGTNGTRRGMHFDQGMHGEKNFGKHGAAANPYAFGYFEHLPTKGDGKRFSQALCVYEADLMALGLGGRIVAPNSLHNFVYVSRRITDTSTFRVEDEAPLLTSTDRWFRPVDIKVGPDGALYMADWYDTRLSHVSPVDDWSKQDGRIYRVRPANAAVPAKTFNLHTAPPAELIAYLRHPNKWFRRQAALELSWRDLRATIPELERLARDPNNTHAFDAVCALDLLGALKGKLATELLRHPDSSVRRWVVRQSADGSAPGAAFGRELAALATREPHAEVRTQLLATARRLPAGQALPIARAIMERESDQQDNRIPLLLWWALEAKAESDRDALLALFAEPAVWRMALARSHGIRFLAQRWAAAGGLENFTACTKLLGSAPRPDDRSLVVEGLAAAFEGGKLPPLPSALAEALNAYLSSKLDTDLALAVKTGNAEARKRALALVRDDKTPVANRVALAQAFAEANDAAVVPALVQVFSRASSPAARQALLPVAAKFADPTLPNAVIAGYEARFAITPSLKDAAHRMLASRREWAQRLLAEVDAWRIRAQDIAPDVVRQLELHQDPQINALVQKHWPAPVAKLSNQEKRAEFQRLKTIAAKGGDHAKGKALYAQRCAACHTLFDEGGQLGPNLTGYNRANLDFWLIGILDPSAEIREGYGAFTAKLKSGQTLMGMLESQEGGNVILKDMAGQRHTVRAADLEQLDAFPQSLMPEGLLLGLDDTELRDFFAYLTRK